MPHLSAALRIEPTLIDLGGGFPHPFAIEGTRPQLGRSTLRASVESLLDHQFQGWRSGRPKVAFESGRYLVAGAGRFFCTVRDVKRSKDRWHVVLSGGVNHLGGMSGIARLPRIKPDLIPIRRPGSKANALPQMNDVNVVGPLCTPLDTWAQGIRTPGVAIGDALMIPNVGAYGLTCSLIAFLSRVCPVEIILDGSRLIGASQLYVERRHLEVPR